MTVNTSYQIDQRWLNALHKPFLLALFLLGLTLSACAHQQVDPGFLALVEYQDDVPVTGELGPSDKFTVRVFEESELSGDFTVSTDGTINYPYLGRIKVAGQTCADVEDLITAQLKQNIVRNPSVTCTIAEYNSKRIYVFGEVKKPGSFSYQSNITIIETLALAGGFSNRANTNNTKLTRVINEVEIQVRVPVQEIMAGRQRNIRLLPGDIIYVPESAY